MFTVNCNGDIPKNCMKCNLKHIIEETNEIMCMALYKTIAIKELNDQRYEECPIEVDDLPDWNGEYLDAK